MTVRTATELLGLIENTLGWVPEVPKGTPRYKAIAGVAGRMNRKIQTNPALYTWANLELAVAYLWRKRQPIKSPFAIFYVVQDAVDAAHIEPERPIGDQVEAALREEYARDDDQAMTWITRLSRAYGDARIEVLAEWRKARQ